MILKIRGLVDIQYWFFWQLISEKGKKPMQRILCCVRNDAQWKKINENWNEDLARPKILVVVLWGSWI